MGIEWIIFIDIDEYIQVSDDTINSSNNRLHVPELKYILDTYYKNERENIGGLVMKSIPFGTNFDQSKSDKKLVIDHVYRQNIDPDDAPFSETKQIVNPQNVHNFAIRWLGGGDTLKEIRLDADRVRINHYKEVITKDGENETIPIKDTVLANKYHDKLVKLIAGD